MFEVDRLSSYLPNCQKNNMGASQGVSDTPQHPYDWGASDGPHVIFS